MPADPPAVKLATLRGAGWLLGIVLALGTASVALLVGTNWIREQLLTQHSALVRTGGEIQARLATAHLWVEEYVTGDDVDLEEIATHLERSAALLEAMLEGGEVPWALYSLQPVKDAALRSRLLRARGQMAEFSQMSKRRQEGYLGGEEVGIGSPIDAEFDRVFNSLLAEMESLNAVFAGRLDDAHARSRMLFRIVLAAWILIVALAATGLWKRALAQRRAEEALRKSEAQLFQAQKMESIGRLAGGIAHDINNYLAAITAQCEVVRMKSQPEERLYQKMDSVIQAAARASSLIQRLLAFSRRQPVLPEVLSLNRIVEELTPLMERLIGEDISLETRFQEGLWNVKIDPAQLEQIIVNLLVNSREAMPRGGMVTLETANADFNAEYLETHPVAEPGDYVMLAVSDTGSGIPAELQDKIFEPFVTTKAEAGSSGLGLATVYGAVKQSGGHIWLYSEPGHGATFKIYLPRSVEPETVRAAEGRLTKEPLGKPQRVLLVEDNEELRASAGELLRGLGFSVLVVASGQEALEAFAREGSDVNLMITDVIMPDMNGRQLADELLKQKPALKVLFVSGYTADVMLRHGLSQEDVNFLPKPFSAKQLSEKIRHVLSPS